MDIKVKENDIRLSRLKDNTLPVFEILMLLPFFEDNIIAGFNRLTIDRKLNIRVN